MKDNRFNEGVLALAVIGLLALFLLVGMGVFAPEPTVQASQPVVVGWLDLPEVPVCAPAKQEVRYVYVNLNAAYGEKVDDYSSLNISRSRFIKKSIYTFTSTNIINITSVTSVNTTTITNSTVVPPVVEETQPKKVTVCHKVSGQGKAHHNLVISVNALSTHLAHGDTQGECQP